MKAKRTFYLLVIFLIGTKIVYCQDTYTFRVLANKGGNTIKLTLDSQSWHPLKTGVKLFKENQITIVEDGYVGLVHSSGKTIELKTPGLFVVSDIQKKLSTTTTSLAGKYADFVFTQMTKEEKEDVNKNSRINNKVAGAVERSAAPIHVLAPSTSYIHGPIAVIKWEAPRNTSEFTVSVKNLFENNLLLEKTEGRTITIDINDPKLKNEKLLIVNVKSKEDEKLISNEIGIKKLPEEELKKIDKDFIALQAETSEETPLNKIIIATFYEQNNLLLDAIANYEAALKLAPDIQDFKTAYDLFLIRNNLKN